MELSWAINWKLLRAFSWDFPCFFMGFSLWKAHKLRKSPGNEADGKPVKMA